MPQSIKIDRSDIISIMALLMSLGAIFVSIKQTSILKEQQKIMASQQEGSVWPNIKVNCSMTIDSFSLLKLEMTNKGVGPAIIKTFDFNTGKEKLGSYKDLISIAAGYGLREFYGGVIFDNPTDKIISPGEKVTLIQIGALGNPDQRKKLSELMEKLSYSKYCYESIYKKEYGDNCN